MFFGKDHKLDNDVLKAELAKARALAQTVSAAELTAFDKASIEFVNQHSQAAELEAFRAQMKRICELAGVNYELEKSRWWKKHNGAGEDN